MDPFRRLLIAWLTLAVIATACTPEPEAAPAQPEPSTTSRPTTTSTTQPPAPPMTVTGVPDELAALITSLYDHAAGVGTTTIEPRYLPERGAAEGMAGRTATGGVAALDDTQIGLVRAGEDLIAAIEDGGGWQLVAVDLPTLGHRDLGYTSAVIAVVGSDARKGEDPLRARADSLHLVGFDGVNGTFDILGIPRDSWVSIPGRSAGKINSALATGGPDSMQATLESLAGYSLDGMLVTGFEGFQEALGNVLGGIQITLETDVRDSAAGADFTAGEQYMNGPQALAFARTRKSLRLGDIDRQRNGGLVLIAAASTARFRSVEDAATLVADAMSWAWTELSPEQILRLSMTSLVAPVMDVANEVLPGVPGERSGASTIELAPEAARILGDLEDGSLQP